MELKSINIKNYKCIESVDIPIRSVNGSNCNAFLGINESGKSSILQAVNLFENPYPQFPRDYFDKSKSIEVKANYILEDIELDYLRDKLKKDMDAPDQFLEKIKIDSVQLIVSCENRKPEKKTEHVKQANNTIKSTPITKWPYHEIELIEFSDQRVQGYTVNDEGNIVESEDDFIDLNELFESNLSQELWNERHRALFWKYSSEFLISEPIDLEEFADDPYGTSIPLHNSFNLMGIATENISGFIESLDSPTDIHDFENKLGDELTKFIRNIWKNHPILIKIKIDNGKLSFLVEDEEIAYKSKTVPQRSDGFKQFVSFLLSVAIENRNEEFRYNLLLLDEPETHLHPSAQLDLLSELLVISKKNSKNIVLYSTHSPYLIDRKNLNRSFKVKKEEDCRTTISKISMSKTTYAEINYELFEIPTTDYHNELFGLIEEKKPALLDSLPKEMRWRNIRTGRTTDVSKSTYIRHAIHHPENEENRNFSLAQLRNSIEKLRELREKI